MYGETPISHWIGFHLFILLLLAIELIYVRWQGPGKTHSTSIAATTLWVSAALAFALFILRALGGDSATQYLPASATHHAPSLPNLSLFIPAVLPITWHTFPAFTPHIMAGMGLPSLSFLLAHLLTKLRYIHYGLSAVLAFAALKMLGAHWIEVGPMTSLAVIIVLLSTTVLLSLTRRQPA